MKKATEHVYAKSDRALFGSAPTLASPATQLKWITERFPTLPREARRAVITCIAALSMPLESKQAKSVLAREELARFSEGGA